MARRGRRGRRPRGPATPAPIGRLPEELTVAILARVPDDWLMVAALVSRTWYRLAVVCHGLRRAEGPARLARTLMATAAAEGCPRVIVWLHNAFDWPWSAMTSRPGDAPLHLAVAYALAAGGLSLARTVSGGDRPTGPYLAVAAVALGDRDAICRLGLVFSPAALSASDAFPMANIPTGFDFYDDDTKTGSLLNMIGRLVWTDSPHPASVALAFALQRDDLLDAMKTPQRVRDSVRRIVKQGRVFDFLVPESVLFRVERVARCALRHGTCGRALALDALSLSA